MEKSEKKKRARRPRSSHNRARSASRDRRTPDVDFDLNSEYFDSIATSGQAEGRTSRQGSPLG